MRTPTHPGHGTLRVFLDDERPVPEKFALAFSSPSKRVPVGLMSSVKLIGVGVQGRSFVQKMIRLDQPAVQLGWVDLSESSHSSEPHDDFDHIELPGLATRPSPDHSDSSDHVTPVLRTELRGVKVLFLTAGVGATTEDLARVALLGCLAKSLRILAIGVYLDTSAPEDKIADRIHDLMRGLEHSLDGATPPAFDVEDLRIVLGRGAMLGLAVGHGSGANYVSKAVNDVAHDALINHLDLSEAEAIYAVVSGGVHDLKQALWLVGKNVPPNTHLIASALGGKDLAGELRITLLIRTTRANPCATTSNSTSERMPPTANHHPVQHAVAQPIGTGRIHPSRSIH